MFQTPDNVTLYTQEDIDTLKTEADNTAREQFQAGTQYGIRCRDNELNIKALAHFKEVASGAMDKDEVVEAYNDLANALGWDTVTTLNSTYHVSVMHNGTIIGEFSGVEAEDTDSAEEEVRSNLEIEDVEIHFTLNYNGETETNTSNITYEFDHYELDFEAVEED